MAKFMNFMRNRKIYSVRRTVSDRNCKDLYRFERENVKWLGDYFLGEHVERREGALSSENQIKTFLRYLGDPGFQSGVGEDVGIHRTTVSKTFSSVLTKVVEKAPVWIQFPKTVGEFEAAKVNWQTRYKFPCAIGALDCTHIPILKPHDHGDEYINRKGNPTLNVQATCDFSEKFTSVDCSWPGSVHDSRIWTNSDVYLILKDNVSNALILGDEGYGITPWLMTPYKDLDTPEKISFNRMHKRERVIIERCFGQIKQRFPILHHKMRLSLDKVPLVVVACAVLHNIAKDINDDDFELPHQEEDYAVPPPDDAINYREQGKARRMQLANIIHNL